MFMIHSIRTMIYAETLINQAVDSFASSCFRESRLYNKFYITDSYLILCVYITDSYLILCVYIAEPYVILKNRKCSIWSFSDKNIKYQIKQKRTFKKCSFSFFATLPIFHHKINYLFFLKFPKFFVHRPHLSILPRSIVLQILKRNLHILYSKYLRTLFDDTLL